MVGVPEITPEFASSATPVGSAPDWSAKPAVNPELTAGLRPALPLMTGAAVVV